MADQGSQLGPTEVVYSLDSPRSVPLDTGPNANTSSSDPFEGEQPKIQGLLEKVMELETEIQTGIASSKATTPKKAEIREPLKEIMKILVQQQVMIGHLMGRLSSETKENTFICTDFILFCPPFWSKG
ncbi:hypothetical protein AVEN_226816-1 [Araneus ventricosus]|uniref:Uncharacterized protein n=1 Tax=Araneus ventricosus TaxID=182803 RepID=A0A4Y2V2R9_ARAVE|nr:hypothetical protein AVEN_226816-1 [Araneus ventricosus]